eukprot:7740372-Pyramimonas_sp.AAC.1
MSAGDRSAPGTPGSPGRLSSRPTSNFPHFSYRPARRPPIISVVWISGSLLFRAGKAADVATLPRGDPPLGGADRPRDVPPHLGAHGLR